MADRAKSQPRGAHACREALGAGVLDAGEA
jgi:hypothetical protein